MKSIRVCFGIRNILAFVFVLGLVQFNNAFADETGRFGETGLVQGDSCERAGCHEVAIAPEVAVTPPSLSVVILTATPGTAVDAGTKHTFIITMSGGPTPAVGDSAVAGFGVAASGGTLSENTSSVNPTQTGLSPVEIAHGDGLGGAIPGDSGPVVVTTPGADVTWTFDWTAPAQTPGEDITIYTAVVAGDGDGSDKGPDAAAGIVGDGVTLLETVISVNASVDAPPVAMITAPAMAATGATVTFDGSGSTDADGPIVTYNWDFGDGTAVTGPLTVATTTHTYATAGVYTVSLIVTDSAGGTNEVTTTITISDVLGNQPPVAVIAAEPTTGTAGTLLAFDGSGSTDPDAVAGDALTYAWDFGDGGTSTLATPPYTYMAAGTFTVTLTVTDVDGLTGEATTTITIVGGANLPPVAVITAPPTTGTVGTALSFDGSGSSDPDAGDTVTYAWDFGDGGTSTLATPPYTYMAAGTFTVTLAVTDSAGLTNEATTIIVISAAANLPPVAVITAAPTTGAVGAVLSFDGSGSSDPDAGDTITYEWDFGDNSGTSTTANSTYTYTAAGTFTVTLTVTDGAGLTNEATTTIVISAAANLPPVAVITAPPTTGTVGTALSFNGSGSSDPDAGDTITYAWDFGDNSGTSTTARPTYTYAAAGTFTVTLTVTDGAGLTNEATTTIVISAAANLPPVAVITAPPTTGTVGTMLSFNGSGSSDPDAGDTITYAWDFGDNSGTSTTARSTYTYTAAGTFTVTLTVTDSAGLTNEATTTIVISAAANLPPVAVITAAPTTGTVGTALSFNGSGSSDPDAGDTITYAWDFGDNSGTSTTARPTYTYTAAGTFTVTLTVTDGAGLTNEATTTIVISAAANLPPVAVITAAPTTGTVGTALSFDGSGSSDPDAGDTITYAWDFGDNSGTSTLATPTYTYMAAGTFTVTLTVTDSTGLTNEATTTIVISAAANLPPVAVITAAPTTGTVGTALSFDGSGSSDPDAGDTITYAWDFGDNSGTSTLATPTYTYMAAGTFTVTLMVTDSAGLTNEATTTIIIDATTPGTPVAVITAPPTTGTVGTALSFDGSNSSDPDAGDTITYAWDFGDNSGTSTLATPTYTYMTAGTFTVTLTVTDDSAGALASMATTTVTIAEAANLPPVAMISGPTTGTAGTMITFSGAGSNDPEKGVLTYAWDLGEGTTGTLVDISNSFAIGTYTITLTVTDDIGLTGSATANIVITAGGGAAQPPVADAGGPYRGTEAIPVVFDGSASIDPDAVAGDVLIYDWDFGDAIVAMDAGPTPSHTYSAAGTFTVLLTVTDVDGMSGSSTTSATIAVATAPPPPTSGAGEELYINNCESCHGVGGVSGSAGGVIDEDAEDIAEAIEEESAMNSLATLTEDEIMLIANFLTTVTIRMGGELYTEHCESCHGAGGVGGSAGDVIGEDAHDIEEAIEEEPTMNSLAMLTEDEIMLIAHFLNEGGPMQSSAISQQETLYITFCASCHGVRGTGGFAVSIQNTTVGAIKDAVINVDTMRVQVSSLLNDQYIDDIVTYLDQPSGISKPGTGAVDSGGGGGGSLLWLIGLVSGAWMVTRRRRSGIVSRT